MLKFDAGALKLTMAAFRLTAAQERVAGRKAVEAAGRVLRDLVKQNISLTDHTLADLAAMGHPYARRHGSIQIHRSGSNALANPENRVHTHTGRLVSSLRSGPTPNGLGYRVELDPKVAPHAAYVLSGTRLMLPRDVIADTAAAPDVKRRMLRAVVTVLGKELRTQASIRAKR